MGLIAGDAVYAIIGKLEARGQPNMAMFEPDPWPEDRFLRLAVQRFEKKCSFFVMGGRLTNHTEEDEPATDFIALGDHVAGDSLGEVQFRNVRIRKAPAEGRSVGMDTAEGLEDLRLQAQQFPSYPDSRMMYAWALSLNGRYSEALDEVNAAQKIYPKVTELHRVKGSALCALGRFSAAVEAMETDMKYFPHAIWSRAQLAWIQVTAPDEKLRSASRARQHLSEIGPVSESPSLVIIEAVIDAEEGRFDNAKARIAHLRGITKSASLLKLADQVSSAIEAGRPYRMPESGELPPMPTVVRRLR